MALLLEYSVEKALDGLVEVGKIIIYSKSEATELKKKLLPLKDVMEKISQDLSKKISDPDSSSDRLKQYKDFQVELNDGLQVVEELENINCFDLYRRFRYGKKVIDLHKKIKDFIAFQGSPFVVQDLRELTAAVKDLERRNFDDMEKLTAAIRDLDLLVRENFVLRKNNNPSSNTTQLSQTSIDGMVEPADRLLGLDNRIDDVRKFLLQDDVKIVGVTGMGGIGKTTLALALRHDLRVQADFNKRVFFFSVSEMEGKPNGILDILGEMWNKILGGPIPCFHNKDDARRQLQETLSLSPCPKTLVILDDVWSQSNAELLLFKAKGYKTVITSRQNSIIRETSDARLYKMRILDKANALSLFCYWAFGQKTIPPTEKEDLVKKVAEQCHGLPLALKVIGSCLRNQSRPVWECAHDDLSRAEYREDRHKEDLLDRLEISIRTLDDEQKQCFLDLGAFPQGRKFSVDSLLDIWVYVRQMKWHSAFVVLLELASRNLLDLTGYSVRGAITYNCASELFFSQHDVMRRLALHLASQNIITDCDRKRLFMPCKDGEIPTNWQTFKNQSPCPQFLSIHTGVMEEKDWDQDWRQIDFREVEALALFFASSKYCLPTFLDTMPKLKVLIIYNYGSQRATLSGLQSFPSFVQIRSVLLHKLIVPPFYENCKYWERLEKLYVCLCEGLESITLVDNELEDLNFPKIIEINLDHCSDLSELPVKLCSLTSLQKLSITNCHLVPNLPDNLGSLSSLKVLRLSACTKLSRLPHSMCDLGQLEYLDISLCSHLQNLPTQFDQLPKLETLDIRECSGLKNLPALPAFRLKSLKHVIMSENHKGSQTGACLSTIRNANIVIEVVPEHFGLEWLDE